MNFKKALFFILPFFCCCSLFATETQVFVIDSLGSGTVKLNKFWKSNEGDSLIWASPLYNDEAWIKIPFHSAGNHFNLSETSDKIMWYRLWIKFDSSLYNTPVALEIEQEGASEIYFDGKKYKSYGKVSPDKNLEIGYDPSDLPLILDNTADSVHLLAIRYSNHLAGKDDRDFRPQIEIFNPNLALEQMAFTQTLFRSIADILIGFFAGLTFLHMMLFFYYKADRNNLYYSFFTITLLIIQCIWHFYLNHTNTYLADKIGASFPAFLVIFFYSIYMLIVQLFNRHNNNSWLITFTSFILVVLSFFLNESYVAGIFFFLILALVISVSVSIFSITYRSIREKQDGAIILGIGFLFFALFVFSIIMTAVIAIIIGIIVHKNHFDISFEDYIGKTMIALTILSLISIPLSMSIYLARSFAIKSKTLTKKLIEVEDLSAKTILQAKEKEEILSSQNETLEKLVTQRTFEVVAQKEELEIKNKEITDSLHYARHLQDVILPSVTYLKEKVENCFVLYKPKDIVAGDFYFAEEVEDYFFVAAADCTGHGVPGAMLSVLCSNALNQAIKEFGLTDPATILDKVNDLVSSTFEKSNQEVNDGMDISLLAINRKEKVLKWAGANIPLWLTMENQLYELKGDKQPIGKHLHRMPFTSQNIPWNDGTWFYLLTDGFADQFGGKAGKKFMRKNLFELITNMISNNADEQAVILNETFLKWTGTQEQVDDVTVIGIKI